MHFRKRTLKALSGSRAPRAVSLLGLFALVLACGNPFTGEISDTTELETYESCNALEAELKEVVRGEIERLYNGAVSNTSLFSFNAPMPMALATDGSFSEAAAPRSQASDPFGTADPEAQQDDYYDFSVTNNQEAGVDEADLVKTDGEHLFVLDAIGLQVFAVPEPGELIPVSSLHLTGQPSAMLLGRDRAIVFSLVSANDLSHDHPLRSRLLDEHSGACEWVTEDGAWISPNQIPSATKLTILDVSDRTDPQLQREIYMQGDYQTARRIDETVLVGIFGEPRLPGLTTPFRTGSRRQVDSQRRERLERLDRLALDSLLPAAYERTGVDQYEALDLCANDCSNVHRPSHSTGRGLSSIIALDIDGDSTSLDVQSVIGNRPAIYASRDRIYIAESARDWWWYSFNPDHPDQTNVHAFDIVGSGQITHLGSARVNGRVLNQFSLSEHDGHLRMATTERLDMSRLWEISTENHVFVMSLEAEDGQLPITGHVGGIEPDEPIFSARFSGEKGFIVTFPDQPRHGVDLTPPTTNELRCGFSGASGIAIPFFGIDPLFTIDLSDPTDPRVIGDLKVTGFSTYIHPIEQDRLLTVGMAGDDEGSTWGFQVSLFDVARFEDPSLLDSEEILGEGDIGGSEALFEHKAFTYWARDGMLAVPVSSTERVENEDGIMQREQYARLEIISVDSENLSRYGAIDHSPLFIREEDGWTQRFEGEVRRSFFMGDFIYSISDAGIMAHAIDNLDEAVAVELFGFGEGPMGMR